MHGRSPTLHRRRMVRRIRRRDASPCSIPRTASRSRNWRAAPRPISTPPCTPPAAHSKARGARRAPPNAAACCTGCRCWSPPTRKNSRNSKRATPASRSNRRAPIRPALARYFEFYAGAADKLHGETLPYQAGYTVLTIREPHGVTGHIVPWNYPMQIFGRSVGAALATGNACVVKPAEDACLSVLRVAELAAEAGLPAGALNIVTGYGHEAGAALARHPGIDHISFTGSPETGKLVDADGRGEPRARHAGTGRQVAANRVRRCRSRRRAARAGHRRSCRTPGKPARRAAAC